VTWQRRRRCRTGSTLSGRPPIIIAGPEVRRMGQPLSGSTAMPSRSQQEADELGSRVRRPQHERPPRSSPRMRSLPRRHSRPCFVEHHGAMSPKARHVSSRVTLAQGLPSIIRSSAMAGSTTKGPRVSGDIATCRTGHVMLDADAPLDRWCASGGLTERGPAEAEGPHVGSASFRNSGDGAPSCIVDAITIGMTNSGPRVLLLPADGALLELLSSMPCIRSGRIRVRPSLLQRPSRGW